MKSIAPIPNLRTVMPIVFLLSLTPSGTAADEQITATREDSNLRLSWGSRSNQLFTVQWTTSLGAPAVWINFTNMEAVLSGSLVLTVPMTNTTCFFRVVEMSAPELDPDADGLSNLAEAMFGTQRLVGDTDGDGLPDAWEVRFGLDPNSGQGNNGAAGDPDNDGISNDQELQLGLPPQDGVYGNPVSLGFRVFRPTR